MNAALPPAMPPRLAEDGHKGDAGRLLLVAGSRWMPGAALLAARAAQRGGAGLVAVASLDGVLDTLLPLTAPEAVLVPLPAAEARAAAGDGPKRTLVAELVHTQSRARAIGPGLGLEPRARGLVEAALSLGGPAVLDADGLNAYQGRPEQLRVLDGPLVLTPHPGEAARLLGRPVPRDGEGRVAAALELARLTGAVVVLKGAGTVVAEARVGESRRLVNGSGNPGMATAGSGDVLAGLLGAYLCRLGPGFDAFDAAAAAVWVHGRAGDLAAARLGQRALCASDLLDHLGPAQLALDGV
ncbi:MAG: NAD(P)H-hydrate dehydratase [Planctomycetaceae bacterium]|nr:NAD(P)H-hydrate dehydratase [Planctomycetaceae bacterium]